MHQRLNSLKRLSGGLAMVLVGVAAASCGSSDAESGSGDLEELPLITFNSSPWYVDTVAQEKGFFEDNGLDVSFIEPQAGASAFQLMLGGEVAGLIADSTLALSVIGQQQNAKITGAVFNANAWRLYAPESFVSANEGLTYPESIHALKGSTIGVTGAGAGSDMALRALLVEAGLDPEKDVTIIGVGQEEAAAPQLKAGKIDAFVNTEPAGSFFREVDAAVPYFDFGTDAPEEIAQIPEGVVTVSGKWLADNQDVAQRWIEAYEEAIEWVEDPENRDEAAELFAEHQGGTVEDARNTVNDLVEIYYPENQPGLTVSEEVWDETVEIAVRTGIVDDAADVPFSDSVAEFAKTS